MQIKLFALNFCIQFLIFITNVGLVWSNGNCSYDIFTQNKTDPALDNEYPIRKLYVKGHLIYVRQVNLDHINLSPNDLETHSISLDKSVDPENKDTVLSNNLHCFDAKLSRRLQFNSSQKLQRIKRFNFPALFPSLFPQPAAPAAYPQQYAAQPYVQQQYAPQVNAPAPPQRPVVPPIIQAPQPPQQPPRIIYINVPGPPGPPGPCIPTAPAPPPPPEPTLAPLSPPRLEPNPDYPLPECYTDDSNFMCCNMGLERALQESFDQLMSDNCNLCNIQKISNAIQKNVEDEFNTNFEVLTGLGDFASKSRFYHNYICKIERQGRFILAYATPRPEEEDSPKYVPRLPDEQSPKYMAPTQGDAGVDLTSQSENNYLNSPNYGSAPKQQPQYQSGGAEIPSYQKPNDQKPAPVHEGYRTIRRAKIYNS